MRDDVYEEMFRIEDTHWWYVAKQRIVSDLIARFAPKTNGRLKIADLGCGCGAMLNRFVKVQASPWAVAPEAFDGAIMFLEDYNTPSINIWNDLQVLRLGGAFDRISGLIIGPVDGISILEGTTQTLREVVDDVVGEREIPVLANVNCGHSGPNVPLPLGVRAAIDAEARTIELVEAAVN